MAASKPTFLHIKYYIQNVNEHIKFVDKADSNQLPPRKPFGFMLKPTLVFYLRASRPVCCPFYTIIILRTFDFQSKPASNDLIISLNARVFQYCSTY